MSFVIGLMAAVAAAIGMRFVAYYLFPLVGLVQFTGTATGMIVQTVAYTAIEVLCYTRASKTELNNLGIVGAIGTSLALRFWATQDGVIAMFVYHYPWMTYVVTGALTSLTVATYATIAWVDARMSRPA